MAEKHPPTYLPGDELVYGVRFNYPANVRTVSATFRNETTGAEVVLLGEASLAPTQRRGTRTQIATLYHVGDPSEELVPGRYRLARLEAITYGGKPLDFDNPPEDGFIFEEEPDETTLPRLDRQQLPGGRVTQATWFEVPEGHPGASNSS